MNRGVQNGRSGLGGAGRPNRPNRSGGGWHLPGDTPGQKCLWVLGVGLRLLLVVILAVLQTSLLTRFHVLGAVPDLVGAYVLAAAYYKGDRFGMIAGLGGGVLVVCLFYPLMALFFGNSGDDLRARQGITYSRFCLSALIATGVRAILEVLLRIIGGGLSFTILPQAGLFFLFAAGVGFLMALRR